MAFVSGSKYPCWLLAHARELTPESHYDLHLKCTSGRTSQTASRTAPVKMCDLEYLVIPNMTYCLLNASKSDCLAEGG